MTNSTSLSVRIINRCISFQQQPCSRPLINHLCSLQLDLLSRPPTATFLNFPDGSSMFIIIWPLFCKWIFHFFPTQKWKTFSSTSGCRPQALRVYVALPRRARPWGVAALVLRAPAVALARPPQGPGPRETVGWSRGWSTDCQLSTSNCYESTSKSVCSSTW